MPAVPRVPGVPSLASYLATAGSIILLTADALRFFGILLAPRWGIFQNGRPVIYADNTVSFEYKQDFPISDYPVEDGGFQSYNKVQLPGDVRMRFSAGGSELNRQAFVSSIDAAMNTTDLYDCVTPEKVYLGYCFSHQDVRRTARNGAGLIVVDLWLTQIRVSSSATFSNTQQPGNAGPQALGNVQPQDAGGALQITVTPADIR